MYLTATRSRSPKFRFDVRHPVDPYTNGTVQLPGLFNSSEPGLVVCRTAAAEYDPVRARPVMDQGQTQMRFGGQFTYIQLNIAYGAYNQAVEELGTTPLTP